MCVQRLSPSSISPALFWRPLLPEGDYCPWNQELQSGLWLEKFLSEEEDVATFKGSSRRASGFGSFHLCGASFFVFFLGLCEHLCV